MSNYVKNEEGKLCWVSLEKVSPELQQRLERLLGESDGKVDLELPGGVTLQVYDWEKYRKNHPLPEQPEVTPDAPSSFYRYDPPESNPWSFENRHSFWAWQRRQRLMDERFRETRLPPADSERFIKVNVTVPDDLWKLYESAFRRSQGFSVKGKMVDDPPVDLSGQDVFVFKGAELPVVKMKNVNDDARANFTPEQREALKKTLRTGLDRFEVRAADAETRTLDNIEVTEVSLVKDPPDPNCKVIGIVENHDTFAHQRAWDRAASGSGIGKPTVGGSSDLGNPSTPPKDAKEYKQPLFTIGKYNSDAGKLEIIDTTYDCESTARSYKIRYHGSMKPITVTEHYLKTQNLRALR
jgi:hypothetical protein